MPDVAAIAARVRRAALDQPTTLGDGDCEALRPGWIGQPTNTVTSFAYVGVGGWLTARATRGPRQQRRGALAYAAATAVAGAGSVAYHGPQFAGAEFFHDAPIVAVAGIGAAVPLWRRFRGRTPLPGWSAPLGVAMAATGAVAGAAYLAGRTSSPCCRPNSLLQFHGLWHVGTAAVVGMWGAAVWAAEDDDG